MKENHYMDCLISSFVRGIKKCPHLHPVHVSKLWFREKNDKTWLMFSEPYHIEYVSPSRVAHGFFWKSKNAHFADFF